jgi:hypothetical protein
MPTRPIDRIRESGFFELKINPGGGLCHVKGCKNSCSVKGLDLCQKHYRQFWRYENPQRSSYAVLKCHAKQRGIKFTISFDYYCGLTDALSYHDRGAENRGDVLTIDRVDATKGYEPGNLRIVTHIENSIKGNRERFLPEHIQHMLQRRRAEALETLERFEEEEEERFPF